MFFYRFCFFRTIFKLVEMNKFVKENLLEIPDQGFMYEMSYLISAIIYVKMNI